MKPDRMKWLWTKNAPAVLGVFSCVAAVAALVAGMHASDAYRRATHEGVDLSYYRGLASDLGDSLTGFWVYAETPDTAYRLTRQERESAEERAEGGSRTEMLVMETAKFAAMPDIVRKAWVIRSKTGGDAKLQIQEKQEAVSSCRMLYSIAALFLCLFVGMALLPSLLLAASTDARQKALGQEKKVGAPVASLAVALFALFCLVLAVDKARHDEGMSLLLYVLVVIATTGVAASFTRDFVRVALPELRLSKNSSDATEELAKKWRARLVETRESARRNVEALSSHGAPETVLVKAREQAENLASYPEEELDAELARYSKAREYTSLLARNAAPEADRVAAAEDLARARLHLVMSLRALGSRLGAEFRNEPLLELPTTPSLGRWFVPLKVTAGTAVALALLTAVYGIFL